MRPDVAAFHDAATGTWSYVIADPATRVAAILDPVLDFDAKSARTSHDSAQKLLDHVRAHYRLVHEVKVAGVSAVEVYVNP